MIDLSLSPCLRGVLTRRTIARCRRQRNPCVIARGRTGLARGMKLRDRRWQLHRLKDLPGDRLGLDKRDQCRRLQELCERALSGPTLQVWP